MKFLLFSSLLGLGLAGTDNDQANCQGVSGNGCAASADQNAEGNSAAATHSVDCLESDDAGTVLSYCRCRWGFRGVGSLGDTPGGGGFAANTRRGCSATPANTDVCGDGIVQGDEQCDFGIISELAADPTDEAGGLAEYSQQHAESGNCGLAANCAWASCPWRIARNAPTPLVKWQATGNGINRPDGGGAGVEIHFALWYPKAYHNVHTNPYNCDEMESAGNTHTTAGEPYDQHAGIGDGDNWHWPTGMNIGSNSIDLAKASQEGGLGQASCYALNDANAAGCDGGDPATCEEGWERIGLRDHTHHRKDACAHSIFYQADFIATVNAECYTLKDNGVAATLSYFTSYIRIHNVEVDLDVEDLRNAQYTLGHRGVDTGSPGGMFSRIFTRRNVDIELPFFITFNRTVEATAELAVTSSLFGFSAVVDYVEYIVNAFGDAGTELADGSQNTGPGAGLGSGSGSIVLATSINPGYKLSDASGDAGAITPSAADLGNDGNVAWGLPNAGGNIGEEHPYQDTSFGCPAVNDVDTLDGGGAHRCEQFWKYEVTALACSFQGIFSTSWDVQCNKVVDAANAHCPGASSHTGLVATRDDDGLENLNVYNKVAITFTLDPGPDDCVQEFENDVVLSADLTCSSQDEGGTEEVFHNQMLFCKLVIDSGVNIDTSELVRIENKGPNDAIILPSQFGGHHAEISYVSSGGTLGADSNWLKFELRVTPKQFKQDFDARNPWTIYAQAKVAYNDGTDAQSRRLLSLSPSLAEQRSKCLEHGCADIGPIRSLLQLEEEDGGAVQGSSKAYIAGLDYQPDVPVVADDVYLADLDMGMEDEEDAAQPIVLNTLVLAGLGFLAMH
jgi:hypothetical protein